ncbi:bifunctional folylpolyglutamate synthase/dihydrofolate synthase [Paenibacillus kobensis]|uniref:bifunctional folylpolyglutamate synthase/dihydrofolate synthase n=1 Tax=Paenibacillus kobensis TaxID=59841 RepID=UPI000FD854F9
MSMNDMQSEAAAADNAAPLRTYKEAADWINGLIPFGVRPGLDRMKLLMERMNNPERRLRFIHVAGTNGKGSTCAYLTSVLIACGYDVGTFTSPYITKFTNRFQYNGEDIPEETLLELANMLKPHVEEIAASELGSPTMFEVSTAIAILFFAKKTFPDYVVWETGLGGRMDVTNIVSPAISLITNVGHDHMDILGDTIEAVAMEKAGIIKPGVPVVSTATQPEVIAVLKEKAAESKSTLYLLGEQFQYESVSVQENLQSFRFRGPFRSIEPLEVTLNGGHQQANAALAVMALEVLRQYNALIVEDEDLNRGLRAAAWPGRLEMVSNEPRILMDGAHNPEGAATLAAALQSTYSYNRAHVVIGMLENKNHSETLRHILPIADTLIVTEPDFRKKMSAESLASIASELASKLGLKVNVIIEPDWRAALDRLEKTIEDGDLGVVTGTLYLISDARSRLLHITDNEKGW